MPTPPATGLPGRRLPWQQPIQSKRSDRYVYTFAELISAINDLPEKNLEFPSSGKTIVINAPLTFTKTIELGTQQKGLTILSFGGMKITPAASGMTAFRAIDNCSRITIRNLNMAYVELTQNPYTYRYWNQFLDLSDAGGDSTIEDCNIELADGGSFIECSATNTSFLRVRNNYVANTSGGIDTFISGKMNYSIVSGNMFRDNAKLQITGSYNVISNNYMSNGRIDTSGSASGYNAITGNAHVGTLNQHPTDQVMGNS